MKWHLLRNMLAIRFFTLKSYLTFCVCSLICLLFGVLYILLCLLRLLFSLLSLLFCALFVSTIVRRALSLYPQLFVVPLLFHLSYSFFCLICPLSFSLSSLFVHPYWLFIFLCSQSSECSMLMIVCRRFTVWFDMLIIECVRRNLMHKLWHHWPNVWSVCIMYCFP